MEQTIKQNKINIAGIPAIIWGDESNKVFIHVHGKMSRKEYAENFAVIAEQAGYQTVSFDLPEHGERIDSAQRCDVWNGMQDLNTIADFVFDKWEEVSLFACSLGAYFSLMTYSDRAFSKVMFQSPIVDMKWLVDHMMLWSGVTEAMLEEQKEIETPIDLLRWDYYCYIKEHPVIKWNINTHILYAELDELQNIDCITNFASRFGAKVTVSAGSKHPFMEEGDSDIVNKWIFDTVQA